MFFGRNNDIDDDYEVNDKKTINLKLPLIILGSIMLLIIIIFLIIKLTHKEEIVYEDKLYYINLLGDKEITLYVGDNFIEPGYTGTDDAGNDLTNEIVISDNIDSSVVGNYKVSYTLENITKERNVKVIEKPVGATYIYLYGDVNTFLYVGDTYEEKGCEVIDTVSGSKLKDKVIISKNVDTSKEGIYKVRYSVTNSSGVMVTKERTVIVTNRDISLLPNPSDVTNSNVIINIYVKDELFDYLILPNNTKVTERISTYEVSNNGIYKFTMYNKEGEKIEKEVTISNIDRESPSGSCSGSYGNGISQINVKASDNVGISRYIINGASYTSSSIKLNQELSSVNITIYDKAGNSKNISCKLEDKNPTSSSKPSSSVKTSSSSIKPSSSSPSSYKKEFVLKHYEKKNGFSFDYWINIPNNATDNMPLLLFLHGGCNIHDANLVPTLKQVDYVVNSYDGTPFILLAPVNGTPDWHSNSSIPISLKGLLDKTVNDYNINTKKIYIMGFSMGSMGTWNMVNLYPDYFAAAVPISCCQLNTNNPKNFLHTKIRAISGTYDPNNEGYYHSCMTSFVNAINNAGGNATKDTYFGHSHSTISSAIKYDELFDWLLKQ